MGENIGDSKEVQEDSFLSQFRSKNRKITFIGDDFWTGLYKSQFERSFVWDSLDVVDLDGNDKGIMSHIFEEMQNFDILICHFLGIDHAGHTFDVNH
jgi:GPI ethanolamine phosphate transferase 3 subunit O